MPLAMAWPAPESAVFGNLRNLKVAIELGALAEAKDQQASGEECEVPDERSVAVLGAPIGASRPARPVSRRGADSSPRHVGRPCTSDQNLK